MISKSLLLLLPLLASPGLSQDSSSTSTPTFSSALISPSGFYDDITEWLNPANTSSQSPNSKNVILDNISVNGSVPGLVIAAQSWVHPDYAYHWTRDAALVYDCLIDLYAAFPDGNSEKDLIAQHLTEYISNSKFEQEDPTAIGGIGEPKYYLGNNSGYQGSWGRPQNDGPALRVSTLLKYNDLYDGDVYGLWDVVKTDLDYLEAEWQNDNFDPWEEVNGTHFFNRFVQRKAFLDAADFMSSKNYTEEAQKYGSIAWEIQKTLNEFYDNTNNFIKVSLEVGKGKVSNKDVSVILAINHAYRADSVFAPTDAYVLSTAYEVVTSFFDVFPISNVTTDDQGLPLAPPTGRYPEDVYDGYDSSEGNPWFLSCAAFAEYFYTIGKAFEDNGEIVLSPISLPFWKFFTDVDETKDSLHGEDFDEAVQKLYGWGDAFLRTVKHYGDGFKYSEQFNKYTGEEQGAHQLTWSHASILTAAFARARALGDTDFISGLSEAL
ncbi:CYFA0S01e16578g1_1 [Cyberlindnera fabianii]|uniref:glucan 1,4-alpha-glucosidase n=1 Tax=Cyberlindnera fabianii TaxID=36022 RepID=E1CJT1_CYBFA|nr:glucoamylase [Cyberlindnera fabianii]CDR37760.1 CYFA0S01e16578g1_1 [Cyberlindnera fabianii]